ncbi:DUF2807 domain-containing protein [Flavobacterium sp. L1I52]|uniref:DUF2807 domain-containing protein n=1 Tax=Flavobacterium pokkalii TaxID=1940408 RepID=A0ABR7UQY2_9FLAO|nr:DUF2807 domain-containing protein [Flavobacterium pokkalii]MBD0724821.1 DUF2807 domain-containing protein [Flavobacterium pokkalii]
MKKISILLVAFLSTTILLAQKKDKISGSKIVTSKQRNIKNFSAIEIEDNIEASLERGEFPEVKIEADDNLIDIIDIDVTDNTLHISTSKRVVKSKALKVKITYTAELNTVISKNDAAISAIQEVLGENFTLKTFDDSKVLMNANVKNFALQADGDSKIELNLKSSNTKMELSKSAELKSLVTTTDLALDMYQKAKAKIEGEANNSLIRLENNSELDASKLEIKSIELIAEGQSKNSVNAKKDIVISATEKSETELYGDAKIEMNKFIDKAKLSKK